MTDVKDFVRRWHSHVEQLQRLRIAASGDTHEDAGELIEQMHCMVDEIAAQQVDSVDGVIGFFNAKYTDLDEYTATEANLYVHATGGAQPENQMDDDEIMDEFHDLYV